MTWIALTLMTGIALSACQVGQPAPHVPTFGATTSEPDAPPAERADGATADALRAALADERRAAGLYRAVIDRHGAILPFVNIVRSERMHARHVEQLMSARGIEVPPDETVIPESLVPVTAEAAYEAGVEAELENIALYDRLLAQTSDEAVRASFQRLRAISEQRHLVAFRRFAGG